MDPIRLAAAMDLAGLVYWEGDSSGDVILNDRFYTFHGTTAEMEGGYRMTAERYILEFVHPDDRAATAETFAVGVTSPEAKYSAQMEKRIVRKVDGAVRHVLTRFEVTKDLDTGTMAIFGISLDVTEQRQARAELERRTADLNEAQRIAGIGSWEMDRSTGEVTFSEQLLRLYGWSPDEPPPTLEDVSKLYSPESWRQVLAVMASAMETGSVAAIEMELVRRDGLRRWVAGHGEPIRDVSGATVKLRGTIQDITERLEQERRNQSLAAAIEQAYDEVVLTDATGTIIYCNPAFEKTSGYSLEESVGRDARFLFGESENQSHMEQVGVALREGRAWSGQFTSLRKDGETYHKETTVSPILSPSGQLLGVVSVGRDVTDRERLEDRVRQGERLESIGRLAGGVAHDFNNLLTVINGYSDVLLGGIAKGHSLRRPAEGIREAGEKAAGLIRQLLAFSRKEAVHLYPQKLNDLITANTPMLRQLVGDQVQLELLLDPGLGIVKADDGQFLQVLMNLAVNARDAMPEGGRLTFQTSNGFLDQMDPRTLGEIPSGPIVQLVVSDTGIGMPEAILQKIFEPFFTTRPDSLSTGLGLSTVYGIVRQFGGAVSVASEIGKGSAFTIYLPRVEGTFPDTVNQFHAVLPAKSPRGSETILVAEDEPAVLEMTVGILEGLGYRVMGAPSGSEALRKAESHDGVIDLLLTDVMMPVMTGKDLADRLTADHPATKVLYMSGYAADVIARRGVVDPTVHFLPKPFDVDSLARKVREVLDSTNKPVSRKVLLLDDNASIRMLFSEILADAGFEVVEAASGAEALQSIRSSSCVAVLADIQVPGTNVYDLVRTLRAEFPKLGIIMASGLVDNEIQAMAFECGTDEVLEKTAVHARIAEVLDQVLARHGLKT